MSIGIVRGELNTDIKKGTEAELRAYYRAQFAGLGAISECAAMPSDSNDMYLDSDRATLHNEKGIEIPLMELEGSEFPREESLRIAMDEAEAFLSLHQSEQSCSLVQVRLIVPTVIPSEQNTACLKAKLSDLLRDIVSDHLPNHLPDYLYDILPDQSHDLAASVPEPMLQKPDMRSGNATETSTQSLNFLEAAGAKAQQEAPKAKPLERLFGSVRSTAGEARKSKSIVHSDANLDAAAYCLPDSEKNAAECVSEDSFDFEELHQDKLRERVKHLSDTFSQYLIYLIEEKGLSNAEVYKRAIVDKKVFSKIKNNPDYHPQKMTAMCLCIGAKLNLDETKDLLARAGYALSPCDKTDIIFSYFIENEIYDMIELDIQLEEMGLKCLIS